MSGEQSAPLLRVANLRIAAGSGAALVEDVSFQMARGDRLALIGPSGAGKSLLGHAIAGLLRPPLRVTSGEIQLAPSRANLGRPAFVVFQNPGAALNPCVRISEQLRRIAVRAGRVPGESAAEMALQKSGLSANAGDLFPFQMSGGMKQRVVFAAALLQSPALLITDEVTTGLDPLSRRGFRSGLHAFLKETGAALLFISHDLCLAAEVCPEALMLDRGRVIAYGPWSVLGAQHPAARELVSAASALGAPLC
jgi:peptide/nickel transport system ATP-binding protein